MKATIHNVGDDDGPRPVGISDASMDLLASARRGQDNEAYAIGGIDVLRTGGQKKPSRRGKHKRNVTGYNPFAILTVEEALPVIRAMARQYPELSVEIRSWLSLYIAPEMTIDYYYGSYVTAMKIVAMMHASKDSIRDGIIPLVQALAAKIVEMVDAKRDAHTPRK